MKMKHEKLYLKFVTSAKICKWFALNVSKILMFTKFVRLSLKSVIYFQTC